TVTEGPFEEPEPVEHALADVIETHLRDELCDSDLEVVGVDHEARGSRAPYFRAHHRPSGAPVLVRLNLTLGEIVWSASLASLSPQLAPTVFGRGFLVIAGRPVSWIAQERH